MASKARSRRTAKLKRSFVITFSALAAGACAGGDGENVSDNPPPPWNTQGGSGGSVGGAGGVGGTSGIGGGSPEVAVRECPADVPAHQGACDAQAVPEMCTYNEKDNPCVDEPDFTLATCEQGTWEVYEIITTCNPPEPEIDEDAGTE